MGDDSPRAVSQQTLANIGLGMGLGFLPVWFFGDSGAFAVVTAQMFLLLIFVGRAAYRGGTLA